MMPQVTIIIPNYNGLAYLETCLASLKKQTMTDFKILIVDNGSTDGSLSWLREHCREAEVLALDKNYGFCAAVNKGIRASDTPYVILLNNDTEAEPEFVEALLSEIGKSDWIFSCQAKMMDFKNRQLMDDAGDYYCALGWAFARGKGKNQRHYTKERPIFAACAGAAIYRRSILDEIGCFDEEHFAYLEDIDIGYRAKIYGYYSLFVPRARIYHMGSATTGSQYNKLKVRLSARNSIYTAYKNMPLLQLILNMPLILSGILLKSLFFVKKHLGKEFCAGIFQGIKLCKKEKKVKYQRKHLKNYMKIQLELWKNIGVRFIKI